MNPAAATAATILGTFILSVAGIWAARGWLEKLHVVAAPNDRSLHESSTVTGGGIAVAGVLVVLWACLWAAGAGPGAGAALLLPVAGLSVLGLMDDLYTLDWLAKLSLQLVLAVLIVAACGPFSELELFGVVVDSVGLNTTVSVLWIVALVNIYNFMDGIDGLAGGYGALCACVLGVWFVLASDTGLSLFMYGLMAACLGFLIWNWSPAKIFLGDAGSMMLGGTFAAVSLIGQREHGIPLGAFVLLYAVFIGDTVYTLARRAVRGEKIWLAHNEHWYQRAVRSGLPHSTVAGIVLFISAIIAALASLEMGRVGPRILWLMLCVLILAFAMLLVKKRETPAS